MASPASNVTARRRGCRTCRVRKIRCDQTRPFCIRCARSGINCQGYIKPTTFLVENPPSSELSLSAEPRTLPYPAEPKHIACLARGMLIGHPGDGQGFSWMRHSLSTSEEQNYLLHTSARCLAWVFYGRQFKLREAITDGLIKYGQMLQVLRSELMKPTPVRTTDLVQVIVLCIMIESVVAHTVGGSNFSGMKWHVDGLGQLLRLQGPKAFQQRSDVLPFEICRCYIVGGAITMRAPTFMAEPQWKTIPWKYEEKNAFTEGWDILCDVPSLLHELERLHLSCIKWPTANSLKWPVLEVQGSIVNPTHNLSLKLKAVLQSLINWRWKWDHHCHNNVTAGPTNPSNTVITDHHGNPQFQTYLSFSDIAIKEIMYYQATLVMVLRVGKLILSNDLLDSVDKGPPSDLPLPFPPTPLLRPTEIESLEDASWEFYRSMEGHLCSRSDQPAVEFYQLMFPLSLVSLGIEEDSIEHTWMSKIRARMMAASGFNLWAGGGERRSGDLAV